MEGWIEGKSGSTHCSASQRLRRASRSVDRLHSVAPLTMYRRRTRGGISLKLQDEENVFSSVRCGRRNAAQEKILGH
ncbi:hypothetical protein [Stenotrophomonas sp. MMGLT7]|uniref:hypothetical protein n=1 Tax=Stenotrophomonas sp. MMGLT7 TaxID=2901227 RepID=UPI001E61252B|nr:hypothetical protein [Stenotrophomonas sp. MMGLT7]MCD7099609.1 hypothetical protein [Stenotrophomonas sp. MMGLT7]